MTECVLVTGGAGFIGSHIVDLFISKGYEVIVVDNLSTGNIKNLNQKAKFYQLDIRDKNLEDVFKNHKIDFICHQAAQVNVRIAINDPMLDSDINIRGFINVLEMARKYDVKKVTFASSVAVYGDTENLPINENEITNPISPYGISKLTGEYFLNYYKQIFNLSFTAFRYANVYGPRQSSIGEGGVVAIFADKMTLGDAPIINGDGNQTRDFVFVGDIATVNLLAIESNIEGILNVSTKLETTINSLFDQLALLTGYKGEKKYGPKTAGDIYKSCLDNSKLEKTFNYTPQINLTEGLIKVINALKKENLL